MARRNRAQKGSEANEEHSDLPVDQTPEDVPAPAPAEQPEEHRLPEHADAPAERNDIRAKISPIVNEIRQRVEPYVAEAQTKIGGATEAIRPYVVEAQHKCKETTDAVFERAAPVIAATQEILNDTKKAAGPYIGKTHSAIVEARAKVVAQVDAARDSAQVYGAATRQTISAVSHNVGERLVAAKGTAARAQQITTEKMSSLVELLVNMLAFAAYVFVTVFQRFASLDTLRPIATHVAATWSTVQERAAPYSSGKKVVDFIGSVALNVQKKYQTY